MRWFWTPGDSLSQRLNALMPDGMAMFLAYDQGFEHGPRDFDLELENYNPAYILDIGLRGGFTGIVFLRGNAERYYLALSQKEKDKLPLILKVNCGNEMEADVADDYDSTLTFSSPEQAVEAALDFRACAVGYTYYLGSKYGPRMKQEFSALIDAAHIKALPVVGWIYSRSKRWTEFKDELAMHLYQKTISREDANYAKEVKKKLGLQSDSMVRALTEAIDRKCPVDETPTIIAMAARAGAELGADIVKIKYSGDVDSFHWAVLNACKTPVVMAGGPKNTQKFLESVRNVIKAGGVGVAVGRNVWQDEHPLDVTAQLRDIIFNTKAD